jgi:hypothetical protein
MQRLMAHGPCHATDASRAVRKPRSRDGGHLMASGASALLQTISAYAVFEDKVDANAGHHGENGAA